MTTKEQVKVERKLGWTKQDEGVYVYRTEQCFALVRLDGELWRTNTYFERSLVDYGEWDGRGVAMRHARISCKHAVRLRSPLTMAKKAEQEDEDDDE